MATIRAITWPLKSDRRLAKWSGQLFVLEVPFLGMLHSQLSNSRAPNSDHLHPRFVRMDRYDVVVAGLASVCIVVRTNGSI